MEGTTGAWRKKGNPVHVVVESVYKFPDLWEEPVRNRFETNNFNPLTRHSTTRVPRAI
jgi:hypothetical protein